ncbi:protein of unknown function [Nannocystis exedens]|uniref:DUF4403 family protein n=1 Tax=Nannocystis exedens TaxID=54 RepID=A0A1I2H6I7_9BACT|nr:DUF4403 family protein [Nannocystis exedens]PCC74012.1 hypothetical protein NAEX_07101 [Nannocystis exedens]SFF24597.1 protein of unknown function [Nannocystis exedens]
MLPTPKLTFATLLAFLCSCTIVRVPYSGPSSPPRGAAGKPKPAKKPKPKPASQTPTKKPTPKPAKPPSGAGKPAKPKPQPKPPAPRPAPRPEEPPPPSVREGTQMVVPLRVDFDESVKKVDSLIQKTITQDWQVVSDPKSATKIEVRYTVWRDPIKAKFDDGRLDVTASVRYAADVRASTKIGKRVIWITKGETWGTKAEPQKVAAKFHADFKIEDDFRVTADAKLDDIDFGPAPSGQVCVKALAKVCISKETVAPMVNKNLQKQLVPKIQQALDQADAQFEKQLNLKKQAQTLWTALQQPQSLQQLGQGRCPTEAGAICSTPAWLVAKPTSIGVSQPRMDGKDLRVDLGLAGQLVVQLGDKPAVKPTPLPKLEPVTDGPGFAVKSRLRLPLGQLNEELTKRLGNLSFGGRGSPEIVVTYVKLVDESAARNSRRLTVAVGVGGAIRGELKLQGELTWNSRARELSIQDFDYTVDSDNEQLKKLSAQHYASLRQLVADKARWKLDTKAAALSDAVAKALGTALAGRLQVDTELTDLEVENFDVKDGVLDAAVALSGKLEVAYTP